MNINRRYTLCIQKLYHRPHITFGGCWNKSLHLQPLQRCYCENSGSPASACVMRPHYSVTYTQLLHAINGLIAVGRVGNVFCEYSSYTGRSQSINQSIIVFWPRTGLSVQTQHSPLYPLPILLFRIFIQSTYHNVVYHLTSSSASNFLPIYHTLYNVFHETYIMGVSL